MKNYIKKRDIIMSGFENGTLKPVRHFEDFVPRDGAKDIFEKVAELDSYLRDSPECYLDGLGLQILGPADHEIEILEKNNYRHKVIMLGSNSYLSLTTHPQVVKASIEACKKYGYGMGSVSLCAGTSDLHRELETRIANFYGTDDGRKTTVDGPTITERQPDGALKATFTQHVFDKDGKEIIKDIFNSAYNSPYRYPHPGGPTLSAKPANWSNDEWKNYQKMLKDMAKGA